MHLNDDPCDCPDALAFRALMNSPVGEGIDRLATTLAVWKLRSLSHELSDAKDWTRPATPYAERTHYEGPAHTPDEIRENAYRSWGMAPPGH